VQINGLQNELEIARNKNQEYEVENESLEMQVQDLTRRIKVLKGFESDYEQVKIEVEELRMQSKESVVLRGRIQELESRLSDRGEAEKDEIYNLRERLRLAEGGKAEAEAMAESAKKAAEKMERDASCRLAVAEKGKAAAEKRANVSDQSLNQMKSENDRRNKAFVELQEKFKESEKLLFEKVKEAEGKAKESMATIKSLEEQMEAMEIKYASADSIQIEVNKLREQEKKLQMHVQSLEKELEQIAAFESMEKEMKEQISIANASIQAHSETVDKMNLEIAELRAEKKSHLEEMASLKQKKHEEEQSGYLEKIADLEKMVDNLNKQLKDSASQKLRNAELEKQNKELRWQIKMLGISVANKAGMDEAEQGGSLAKPIAPTTKQFNSAKVSLAHVFGAILSQKRNIVIFYIVILHCLVYYLSTRCA